jgi:transcriptional regulator with XRE-family HTH domain
MERDKGRPMSFGHHRRGLRAAAGLSRAGLARRASVPASTLRNWEGDRGLPGVQAGLRLAEALGVTLERLAEGVDDPAEDGALAAGEEARRRRQGKRP